MQHSLCLRIVQSGLACRAGGGHTITAESQEVLHSCAPLCPWTPDSPIHPLLYGGLLHLGQSNRTGPKTALSMPLPAQPLSSAQDRSSSQALLCPKLLLSLDQASVLYLSQLSSPGGEGTEQQDGGSFHGSLFICLLKTFCSLSGPHMLDEGPENLRTGFLPSPLTSSCEETGLQQVWLLCKLRQNVPSRGGRSQLLVSTSYFHQRAPWALVGPKETWWHKSS